MHVVVVVIVLIVLARTGQIVKQVPVKGPFAGTESLSARVLFLFIKLVVQSSRPIQLTAVTAIAAFAAVASVVTRRRVCFACFQRKKK